MVRLVAVLTLLAVVILGGPAAWAQRTDPLHIGGDGGFLGSPGALEGSQLTGPGLLQFLFLSAPSFCQGTSGCAQANPVRVYFYNNACTRVDSTALTLSVDDVAVLSLHETTTTANRSGNFLVATADPAATGQALLSEAQLAGISYVISTSLGVGRAQELSRMSNFFGTAWKPYASSHVLIFAPPDDGVNFFDLLELRCPVGTATQAAGLAGGTVVGTANTLGGDMLDLASQDEGGTPGDVFDPDTTTADSDTLDGFNDENANGTFASAVTATVFSLDEAVLGTVSSFTCACNTQVRLSTLSAAAASNSTHWEFFSTGGGTGTEIFTGGIDFLVRTAGLNVNLFHRLHNSRTEANIAP